MALLVQRLVPPGPLVLAFGVAVLARLSLLRGGDVDCSDLNFVSCCFRPSAMFSSRGDDLHHLLLWPMMQSSLCVPFEVRRAMALRLRPWRALARFVARAPFFGGALPSFPYA